MKAITHVQWCVDGLVYLKNKFDGVEPIFTSKRTRFGNAILVYCHPGDIKKETLEEFEFEFKVVE